MQELNRNPDASASQIGPGSSEAARDGATWHRRTLGHGIVIFWGVWLAIVFASNVCDGLVQLRLLPVSWPLASGNFGAISQTTLRYGSPTVVNAVLFLGVIVWEGAATALYLRAALLYRAARDHALAAIFSAFSASLALWGAFVLADEFLIAYSLEAPHLRLFIAQLLSLLYLELVAFKQT